MARTIQIQTRSGNRLAATLYEASGDKLVVINSATGVKQSYYKNFSLYLQSQGITVLTYDYNGIGDSLVGHVKNNNASASSWGQHDIESVLQYAWREFPDKSLIIISHSIGGQILGLAPSATKATKIILVASQSGYHGLWSGRNKWRMWLNWYLIFPFGLIFFGYLPSKKLIGMENLPRKVAAEWRKWCISPNYLFDHVPAESLYYGKVTVPLISYSIEDDDYFAPKAAVNWLAERFSAAKVKRVHLVPKDIGEKNIGHFGVFKKRYADTIWPMLLSEITGNA